MADNLNDPDIIRQTASTITLTATLVEHLRVEMSEGSTANRVAVRRRLRDQKALLRSLRGSLRLAVRSLREHNFDAVVDLYAKALTDVNELMAVVESLLAA